MFYLFLRNKKSKMQEIERKGPFRAKPLPEDLEIKHNSVSLFCIPLLLPFMFLKTLFLKIHCAMSCLILQSQGLIKAQKKSGNYEKRKESLLNFYRQNLEETRVQACDGVNLETYILRPKERVKNGRMIIFLGGNRQSALNHLESCPNCQNLIRLGYTIICFNHRNVGNSDEVLPSKMDLVRDVDAIVQYASEIEGFVFSNILLWARSISGWEGTEVAVRRQGINLVNERSFRSLIHVLWNAAWLPGHRVLTLLAWICDWRMNSERSWKKIVGKKVAVYALDDEIIMGDSKLCASGFIEEDEPYLLDGNNWGHGMELDWLNMSKIISKIFPDHKDIDEKRTLESKKLWFKLKNLFL